MANYTYADFIKAATDAGLAGSFDDSDLALAQRHPEYGLSLVSLKKDLNSSSTNEQRMLVNEAINQLRSNYSAPVSQSQAAADTDLTGIKTVTEQNAAPTSTVTSKLGSTGSSGLQPITAGLGSFRYANDDAYLDLLDKIINREEFSYDHTADPTFSNFRKAYLREGDRAAANALATASAATGGIPSSYANVAAQQQQNYYAAQLMDRIPELRTLALDEYNNDFSQLLQSLSAMNAEREQEYGQYLDALQLQYQKERDKVNDEQTAFENALAIYQATGKITGVLQNYLKGATGGSSSGTISGSWGSGRPYNNELEVGDADLQAQVDAIAGKYEINDYTNQLYVTNWEDYTQLKNLLGLDDAGMSAAGVAYPYGIRTDVNGNSTPATTTDGTRLEDWDRMAGNYSGMVDHINVMMGEGATKKEVQQEIDAAYKDGMITSSDALRLKNQVRDMNDKLFGPSGAAAAAVQASKPTTVGAALSSLLAPITGGTQTATPAKTAQKAGSQAAKDLSAETAKKKQIALKKATTPAVKKAGTPTTKAVSIMTHEKY